MFTNLFILCVVSLQYHSPAATLRFSHQITDISSHLTPGRTIRPHYLVLYAAVSLERVHFLWRLRLQVLTMLCCCNQDFFGGRGRLRHTDWHTVPSSSSIPTPPPCIPSALTAKHNTKPSDSDSLADNQRSNLPSLIATKGTRRLWKTRRAGAGTFLRLSHSVWKVNKCCLTDW